MLPLVLSTPFHHGTRQEEALARCGHLELELYRLQNAEESIDFPYKLPGLSPFVITTEGRRRHCVTAQWAPSHRAMCLSSSAPKTSASSQAPGAPPQPNCSPGHSAPRADRTCQGPYPSALPMRLSKQMTKLQRKVKALRHIYLYLFPVRKFQELHQKILQPLLSTDKNTPRNYEALSGFARDDVLFRFG